MLRKTWFQILVIGIVIGAVLIIVDPTSLWAGKDKPKKFQGPVDIGVDEIYFTKAVYSVQEIDFGIVKEGDTVRREVMLKNTGEEPLYIFKSQGSCDCISVNYSNKPIMPGSEELVTIYFRTKGRKGEQSRPIIITTNTDPSEMTLLLKGKVE